MKHEENKLSQPKFSWGKSKWAASPQSIEVFDLLRVAQFQLRDMLEEHLGESSVFVENFWERGEGKLGGGSRFVGGGPDINRASINFSQVQYESVPEKKLESATALSVIIHPYKPSIPSIHIHVSWTKLKQDSEGAWRLMVDLNPSNPAQQDTQLFATEMEKTIGSNAGVASEEGDKYFWIPALKRHRGVKHYYLEKYII